MAEVAEESESGWRACANRSSHSELSVRKAEPLRPIPVIARNELAFPEPRKLQNTSVRNDQGAGTDILMHNDRIIGSLPVRECRLLTQLCYAARFRDLHSPTGMQEPTVGPQR